MFNIAKILHRFEIKSDQFQRMNFRVDWILSLNKEWTRHLFEPPTKTPRVRHRSPTALRGRQLWPYQQNIFPV